MSNMNVNPFQLIKMIKNGSNPQQLMMSLLQQSGNNNNPILKNAANMAQKGNVSGLEMLGRNLAAQRGIDFDQAWSEFMGYFQ